jgi:hypothetical protein
VIRRLLPLVLLVVVLVPSTAHAHEVRRATGVVMNTASVREMTSSALHGQAGQIESPSPSPSVRPKEEPQGGVVTFGGILIAGVLIGGLLLMRSRLLRR